MLYSVAPGIITSQFKMLKTIGNALNDTAWWAIYSFGPGNIGARGPIGPIGGSGAIGPRGPVGGAIGLSTSQPYSVGRDEYQLIFAEGYLSAVLCLSETPSDIIHLELVR
jgi:hypothetical protein